VDEDVEKIAEISTKDKLKLLINYIPKLNKAFKTEAYGAVAATKIGHVALKTIPTGFGIIPAFRGIRGFFNKKQPAAPTQQPAPTVGGSLKYQQKRYKVYTTDDGKRYINVDKKKHYLKESTKGTYITRHGKREYI
jgi:hypothetical protein